MTPTEMPGSRGSPRRVVSLGGGVEAPYAVPSSSAATKMGRANRRTDTKPEVAVRSELHRRGLRFRKDLLVRAAGEKARPDIVFTRQRVAVFVDGCFWHQCPEHGTTPKTNVEYWVPKFAANAARDGVVNAALAADGWQVLRFWEHELPSAVADRVEALVVRT